MQVDSQRLISVLAQRWPAIGEAIENTRLDSRVALVNDSREVHPGDVFVAVPGSQSDGRDYIDVALGSGAALILCHCDEDAQRHSQDPRVIHLVGLKARLGHFGQQLFDVPETMQVVGVTGTNGKSSVTHYIAALSEALGHKCGVIGTLGAGRLGRLQDVGLTTPGPLALQAYLGEMAADGVTRVAMEVSSHALDQQRLEGCPLEAGVYTNLSRDHLDYHGSMAAYAAAKAALFKREELSLAVVNANDGLARLMLAGLRPGVRVLAVGDDEATTLRVLDWQPHETGQRALIAGPAGEFGLSLELMGRFNLDNLLLAMAVLYGLGEDLDALAELASQISAVPGRMQLLARPGQPSVVIDYAHTPDALSNALTALRAHLGNRGRLWCVFGCGGDRDNGKRPQMAQVAESLADEIIVTDDNPRHERAEVIREQIVAGLTPAGRQSARAVAGRQRAIEYAVSTAASDDVILIAGKGHEPYQEIAGVRHSFSDVAVAEAVLDLRGARS